MFLATKATCSSPVDLSDSVYSGEHKKIALLVPTTPTGPSASHFSQLWDTAQREGLAGEGLCIPEEEQDFLGCSGMLLGIQHSVLKMPYAFPALQTIPDRDGQEASNPKAFLSPAQCLAHSPVWISQLFLTHP